MMNTPSLYDELPLLTMGDGEKGGYWQPIPVRMTPPGPATHEVIVTVGQQVDLI
jgi:hypothetical protein